MKNCKICGKINENPLLKYCKFHYYQEEAKKPKKIYELKKTPVKVVGKKRTERINEKGSEMKMFIEIWQERSHVCKVCGKEIKFFHTSNFAHILGKRDYQELRYNKDNIALVHGVFEIEDEKTGRTYQCHQKLDTETSGKKQEIYDKIIKKTGQK